MKKRWRLRGNKGQSLVEMALALPFLVATFVGLVEVGYALKNYLVVVNANREATRFAARGRWFDSDEEVDFIFQRLVAAAGVDQRGRQALRTEPIDDLRPNTMIAVYYVEVPDQVDELGGMEEQAPSVFGPWVTGMNCEEEYGLTCEPMALDEVWALAEQAREDNYNFNEKYFVQDGLIEIPSEDNFVIIETWFAHEQLLGWPLFTELFEAVGAEDGRFILYGQTQMRVTLSRELMGD